MDKPTIDYKQRQREANERIRSDVVKLLGCPAGMVKVTGLGSVTLAPSAVWEARRGWPQQREQVDMSELGKARRRVIAAVIRYRESETATAEERNLKKVEWALDDYVNRSVAAALGNDASS